MKYFEVFFTVTPCTETACDVVSALAGEAGFETFVPADRGVTGYVQQSLFDEEALRSALDDFPMPGTTVCWTVAEAEDKDWNEEWEKHYFEPIVIAADQMVPDERPADGRAAVCIHSTFHRDFPQAVYDIVINPQMAFGTGHHQTTRLVMGFLLRINIKGKALLDMGCGTGILAILATLRGACPVTAIDIDDWCVSNTLDNCNLNGVTLRALQGTAPTLAAEGPFDVVVANINRNILLADMGAYVARLRHGGRIVFSGFYLEDLALIRAEAERLGLQQEDYRTEDNWCAALFIKKA